MDVQNQMGEKAAHHKNNLVVKVRYIAARKLFIDHEANRQETLSELKPRVLGFFGLVEGNTDGGAKTYRFVLDGFELTDLNATLGSLAEGKYEIDFILNEQFVQG